MVSDPFTQDLARYLAASTGLPQPTTIRVVADVNAYYNETVEEFVRRRHAELRAQGHKNDEIWPQIMAEMNNRRFRAAEPTDRRLRRIVYG
jgi:cytidylate kinase